MTNFRTFLRAVSRESFEIVGGTLVSAVGVVYAVLVWIFPRGVEVVPPFQPWMIVAIGFAIYGHGCFSAWQKERARADRAEARLKQIEDAQPDALAQISGSGRWSVSLNSESRACGRLLREIEGQGI
jgi:hypothetical protein